MESNQNDSFFGELFFHHDASIFVKETMDWKEKWTPFCRYLSSGTKRNGVLLPLNGVKTPTRERLERTGYFSETKKYFTKVFPSSYKAKSSKSSKESLFFQSPEESKKPFSSENNFSRFLENKLKLIQNFIYCNIDLPNDGTHSGQTKLQNTLWTRRIQFYPCIFHFLFLTSREKGIRRTHNFVERVSVTL